MAMTKQAHWELTDTIIGAYYQVYTYTSRTYPEYIYENAMRHELTLRGLAVTQQEEYEIIYKGQSVGRQRLDLFVVGQVVVENKVAEQLTRLHKAQTISYLKTVDKPVGLLLNFGSREPEHNRLYFDPAKKPYPLPAHRECQECEISADWLYPDLCYQIVGGLFEVHSILGAGYVHRIYANACWQELRWRGLGVAPEKRMQVEYKGVPIGDIAFGHMIVEGKVMVFPVAIRDVNDIHLDNLKCWMRQCGIQLGILANFDAIRLCPVYIRAQEEQD
jgi:GxxExxY protein